MMHQTDESVINHAASYCHHLRFAPSPLPSFHALHDAKSDETDGVRLVRVLCALTHSLLRLN